jgi:outer membrane protein OmpA-like peptidoglycan-associated protein
VSAVPDRLHLESAAHRLREGQESRAALRAGRDLLGRLLRALSVGRRGGEQQLQGLSAAARGERSQERVREGAARRALSAGHCPAAGHGLFPCAGADEIGANNRCTRCPSGQVPDAARGKCVLAGGKVPCAIGWVHRAPKLCVPCGATQIVRNDACVACSPPKQPVALRLNCVQAPAPASCPAAERLEISRFGQYQDILASLPADQRASLDALAARIRKGFDRGCRPIRTVMLVGHADHDPSVGAAFEQQVSEKRAKALRDQLVRQLGPQLAGRVRFVPSGVGARDLKHSPARSPQEMLENRRVLISTSN